MRILHLNTTDNDGGAARAVYRLHKGLRMRSVSSVMFVRDKFTNDPKVFKYKKPSGVGKMLLQMRQQTIRKEMQSYSISRPKNLEVFSDDRSPLRLDFTNQLPEADIYHLHWTSGFVDLPSFFKNVKKPIVWTLHDMFPFTGGCHYNSGCEKYLSFCERCPQLGSLSVRDLAHKIWDRKKRYISEFSNRIIIRADSNWLSGEAKRSGLFKGLDIDTIHYGIETDEFKVRDKLACRKALDIPENYRIIAFGAPGIENPRKGLVQLVEALKKLSAIRPNLFLITFGSGNLSSVMNIPMLHMGNVSNNDILSVIYNCADVFVIPSLQEAFGQTALEAMSCGIPVAGFNTGGIPDMVENGITGFLADTGDVSGLANSIDRILALNDLEYLNMSRNCRAKVIDNFTLVQQADKYLDVYKNLMGN